MNPRILIVDDSPTLRRLVDYLLKKKNYQTRLAGNGKECLKILEQESDTFDLIILDMNMPVMNGLEVLTELQKTRYPIPPILILTANNDIREQGLKLGASHFLTKPFRPESILTSISEILETG